MPKPMTTVEPKVMPDPKLEKRTRLMAAQPWLITGCLLPSSAQN